MRLLVGRLPLCGFTVLAADEIPRLTLILGTALAENATVTEGAGATSGMMAGHGHRAPEAAGVVPLPATMGALWRRSTALRWRA